MKRDGYRALLAPALALTLLAPGVVWGQQPLPGAATAPQRGVAPGGPQQPSIQAPRQQRQQQQPRVYRDSKRGYSLVVPPGVQLRRERGRTDISLRSREGWVVNVQTGDASPHVELPAMLGRLEARYLGKGRPWKQKLRQFRTEVAGLPARAALYEGAGSRAEVVIARGRQTDFVFMFFAPPELFERLHRHFETFLGNFKPAEAERPKPEPTVKGEGKAGGDRDRESFSDPALGYRVRHPADWVAIRPSAYAVVFSGREGTPAYDLSVSIQNVQPPQARNPGEAVKTVYANLKRELSAQAEDTAYFGEGEYRHTGQGLSLEGRQFLVNYTDGGVRYKQLTVVLPRPEMPVVYIWSYRAPQQTFHTYWPVVQKMLKGWTILKASTGGDKTR